MRIGQRPQLVLVMLRRLMIVGGDDGSLRKPKRALPQPVVIAIDVPSRKLLFEVHRQAVGERALAEILFQQMGLARVEFMKGAYNLVQLGLHVASDNIPSLRGAKRRSNPETTITIRWIASRSL